MTTSSTKKPMVSSKVHLDDDFLYGEDLAKKMSEKEIEKTLEGLKSDQLDPASWMQLDSKKESIQTSVNTQIENLL